jgi:hypothetical protein
VQALDGGSPPAALLSAAHNGVVKCIARSGQALQAYELLEVMVTSRGAISVDMDVVRHA